MSWKTSKKWTFRIFIIFTAATVLFGAVSLIILFAQPMQTEHVEVIGRRTEVRYLQSPSSGSVRGANPRCFVMFVFSDGSEKEFSVNHRIFDDFQIGDTGILSFREVESGLFRGRNFVSFEKDT